MQTLLNLLLAFGLLFSLAFFLGLLYLAGGVWLLLLGVALLVAESVYSYRKSAR